MVVVKKETSKLGIIRDGIENIVLLILYSPHINYGVATFGKLVQFWLPHLKNGVVEMEKMHKRAAEIVRGLDHVPYVVKHSNILKC